MKDVIPGQINEYLILNGPGIANINLAMQDGYSTSQGLGLGLPGAKRLTDEFAIVSEVGKGTTVTMKIRVNDSVDLLLVLTQSCA